MKTLFASLGRFVRASSRILFALLVVAACLSARYQHSQLGALRREVRRARVAAEEASAAAWDAAANSAAAQNAADEARDAAWAAESTAEEARSAAEDAQAAAADASLSGALRYLR